MVIRTLIRCVLKPTLPITHITPDISDSITPLYNYVQNYFRFLLITSAIMWVQSCLTYQIKGYILGYLNIIVMFLLNEHIINNNYNTSVYLTWNRAIKESLLFLITNINKMMIIMQEIEKIEWTLRCTVTKNSFEDRIGY